jgi:AraC-like DNA-binding protein
MPQVRGAALTNYQQVARFVGLDPTAMLRDVGLDPGLLAAPERPVRADLVAELLERSAERSGCAHFGLLMAESRSLASVGPVSLVFKLKETAGQLIEAIVRYQALYGRAIHLRLEHSGTLLIVHAELAGAARQRQAIELLLGYVCRCIQAVVGRNWSPESVHFTHSAPERVTIHRRVFCCPVVFDNAFNGFVCTREETDAANPAGDAQLAAHAERIAQLLMPPAESWTVAEKADRALRLLLPVGRGTLEQVADNLGMTPRSLQRQLDREGSRFADLLNTVRRELAQLYLANGHHSIGAVAEMTGYQSASAFSRWFCAEFGEPPLAWRNRAA